ncbi:cation:proton antiporter [Nocardia yamanashiensis]|uniref:cation:proton antiporter n=1 Tax=Nocardia yamanashiensis TaxID=209247 RepID=UPI001E424C05|nr:cation:proton antiporter [Nocardia yamanashiensis]UGT38788.1 cation:proton antiporter [Nocardia yamanashiensis]
MVSSVQAAAAVAPSAITSLCWISVVAVAAPLVARVLRGYVPSVVILLVCGMLLGPHGIGWAGSEGGVDLLSELGLGMLFLLAGYELDPKLLGGKPGRVAWVTWLVSLALALGLVMVAAGDAGFTAQIAVAIALTSTALGTLLPILKQDGLLEQPLGRAVLAHGAVGELGPVVAMSVLLTTRSVTAAVIVLALFGIAALIVAWVPRRLLDRVPGVERLIGELAGGTEQLPVRVVLLLLLVLMAVAEVFDLDVVLGAFAAGLILRFLIAEEHPELESALETIGFGLFIPVFFVVSGMGIDPRAVADDPLAWVVFVAAIALARGLPVWISERFVPHGENLTERQDRVQLALYAATGLPIIVAVTQVATAAELMSPQLASILVAAGATTVLLFPLLAKGIAAVRS